MAEPADIGDACLMLASPLARYISGANLVVHGGGEPPPYLGAPSRDPTASRQPAAQRFDHGGRLVASVDLDGDDDGGLNPTRDRVGRHQLGRTPRTRPPTASGAGKRTRPVP